MGGARPYKGAAPPPAAFLPAPRAPRPMAAPPCGEAAAHRPQCALPPGRVGRDSGHIPGRLGPPPPIPHPGRAGRRDSAGGRGKWRTRGGEARPPSFRPALTQRGRAVTESAGRASPARVAGSGPTEAEEEGGAPGSRVSRRPHHRPPPRATTRKMPLGPRVLSKAKLVPAGPAQPGPPRAERPPPPMAPTCRRPKRTGAWSAASEPAAPGLGYKAAPALPQPMSPGLSADPCPFSATDPLAGPIFRET